MDLLIIEEEYWPVLEHEVITPEERQSIERDTRTYGKRGQEITVSDELVARWEEIETQWTTVQHEKELLCRWFQLQQEPDARHRPLSVEEQQEVTALMKGTT